MPIPRWDIDKVCFDLKNTNKFGIRRGFLKFSVFFLCPPGFSHNIGTLVQLKYELVTKISSEFLYNFLDLPQFYLNEICKMDDATGQHTVIIRWAIGYKPILESEYATLEESNLTSWFLSPGGCRISQKQNNKPFK